ncbi:hypothetical protein [Delftia tsuruhatensis]|uniref:hypothetical protein n=1 Tax=Delftia tsuruhatensis TaxID=180282 RepID=UPI000B1A48EC|nr:hypothetical protein [Delftia tsuruhatensis]
MAENANAQGATYQGDGQGLHWTLHVITAPLLLLYFAPVLAIYWAGISTEFFASDPDERIRVGRAIAGPLFDTLRASLSAVFVPFVMAYAIKNRSQNQSIPPATLAILYVFLGFLVASVVLYAIVESRQVTLGHYPAIESPPSSEQENPKTTLTMYEVYRDISIAYAKESLTFVALVLGIAMRPAIRDASAKVDVQK